MSKVIFIDNGHYLHSPGFFWMDNIKRKLGIVDDVDLKYNEVKKQSIPFTFTVLTMIIADLKKVGVDKDDVIILGIDARGSWRKEYETTYKSGRRKLLQELYDEYDWMLSRIDQALDWHLIKIDHVEYDDIAAVGSRYFKDKEVVMISTDSDLEQLWVYKNVKIYSPHKKRKCYKIPSKKFNPYIFIMKKTKKEAADGLTGEVIDEVSFRNRVKCVNLLELPDKIENSVIKEFKKIKPKTTDLTLLPYEKIRERFNDIYKKDKIVTYEKSIQIEEKKKLKKRSKK